MEGRSSLVNALITLTIIAILAVLAVMFKMGGSRRGGHHPPVTETRASGSGVDVSRDAGSAAGAASAYQSSTPSPLQGPPPTSTPPPPPQNILAKALPMGPTEGASGYEILIGSTFLPSRDHSGSRFQISHEGKELSFQLYHVEAPELPKPEPGLRRADLTKSTFEESEGEKLYFDSRDFTRSLLRDTPFHIFTCWEPTGAKPQEYYAFVFVLDQDQARRHWLAELLTAGGHAEIRPSAAVVPDGRTSAEAFTNRLQGYRRSAGKSPQPQRGSAL